MKKRQKNPAGEFVLQAALSSVLVTVSAILLTSSFKAASPEAKRIAGLGSQGGVSFQPPVYYPTSSHRPTSVAVADFNGDGDLDLAVAEEGEGSNPSGVDIMMGNGDGTFQPPVLYEMPPFGEASAVAVGDFNGDGKPDLVVTNFYYPEGMDAYVAVEIFLGNGDGTFQPPITTGLNSPGCLSPDLCGNGLSVAVGDFDRDGNLDVAVANPHTSGPSYYVEVLLGNGDGTFQPEVDYYMPQGPLSVRGINVGDFNGDANLDLVFAVSGSNPGPTDTVGVLLGNGDGSFQSPSFFPLPYGNSATSAIVVGDFNRDGTLDLAAADFNPHPTGYLVGVLIGNGDGTFQQGVAYVAGFGNVSSVAVGDFNRDGNLDLVTTTEFENSNPPYVLLGNGDGTFQAPLSFTTGGRGSDSVAVGDFNRDGWPDLAIATQDPMAHDAVGVLLNAPAIVPQSAFSRKTHGGAGTFDIPLPISGNVGVECRTGGATNDYRMIINFAASVSVQNASVTSGTGSVSSFSVSGSQVTINLTGITNVQRITVTLSDVNDGTHMSNVLVSMGVLIGDVNGNAAVNAADVAQTKARLGQTVDATNFRSDVNANGTINSADTAIVKQKNGTSLPP